MPENDILLSGENQPLSNCVLKVRELIALITLGDYRVDSLLLKTALQSQIFGETRYMVTNSNVLGFSVSPSSMVCKMENIFPHIEQNFLFILIDNFVFDLGLKLNILWYSQKLAVL